MDFEYPYMLLSLLIVPLLVFLFRLAVKRNNAMREQFAKWAVLQQLLPNFAPQRNPLKFWLTLGAFVLLVIAFANPRIGSVTRKVKREGVDVYIALDVSRSMWAKDVKPNGIDRLEKARLFALKMVEEFKGNRIGLIFFAGEAFLQMPLTLDNNAPLLFLNEGLGDFEIMQGTAFEEVLGLAAKAGKDPNDEEQLIKQCALFILSDGEDHDKKGSKAAKIAKQSGVTTYCIAFGSERGAIVPKNRNELSETKDKNGETVISKTDKKWLKDIAEAGSGKFFDTEKDNVNLSQLRKELKRVEKEKYDTKIFDEYESYFQVFVFLALALLLAEFLISYRKKPLQKENKKRDIEKALEIEEY